MNTLACNEISFSLEKAKLIRVVRKDANGKLLRISKHVEVAGIQRPLMEMIYRADGHSTIYLYSDSGNEVEHVIQL